MSVCVCAIPLRAQDLEIVSTPGEVVRPGDILAMEGKGMPKSHGQRPPPERLARVQIVAGHPVGTVRSRDVRQTL